MAESNLQICINKARKYYADRLPLLEQLCRVHGVTQREFASIFGISKAHAEAVIKHRTFPSLELAVRIARYFECSVEELFGWRIDDNGDRRPLLIVDPDTGEKRRLRSQYKENQAMALVGALNASCSDEG